MNHANRHSIRGALLMLVLFFPAAGHAGSPTITNIILSGREPHNQHSERCGRNWVVLTNLVVTQSPYWFVDTVTAPGTQRFYRIVAHTGTNNAERGTV